MVNSLAAGFFWLKWVGVDYLIYLGVVHLLSIKTSSAPELSAVSSFQRGFWISLTNPKTILFFSAFLPQFTSGSSVYLTEIALLSVLFWGLAILLDSAYAILAAKLVKYLSQHNVYPFIHGSSGLLHIGAGGLLAIIDRTSP